MKILSSLLSPDPACPAPEPPAQMPASETRPTDMEMLTRGWTNLLGQPAKSLELMFKGAAEWQRSIQHFGYAAFGEARSKASDEPRSSVTRLSFNKSMTSRRNWAYGTVPLAEVKKIKDALDCTINDVVMALCAGALRRWLLEHNELPEAALKVVVPVSIRPAEEAETAGNQVSAMLADLPTHLVDPLARVQAVHQSMKRAKEDFAALPAALLQEFSQFAAPAAAELIARTMATMRLADKVTLPFNLVISNVPGPREPLYFAGALVEANYPVSMISDGMGLNITVTSYRDSLDFGLISCPELIPDLDQMVEYIVAETAALAAI